jgi:hypothetical protein
MLQPGDKVRFHAEHAHGGRVVTRIEAAKSRTRRAVCRHSRMAGKRPFDARQSDRTSDVVA